MNEIRAIDGMALRKPIGYWRLGDETKLAIYGSKRPRWLTRLLMAALLEWKWEGK